MIILIKIIKKKKILDNKNRKTYKNNNLVYIKA